VTLMGRIRVLPISDHQAEVARAATARLRGRGFRAVLDESNETLSYRIRGAELMKVPYIVVIGQREAEAGTIAVRVRGAGNKQDIMPMDAFIERVHEEVRTRALVP